MISAEKQIETINKNLSIIDDFLQEKGKIFSKGDPSLRKRTYNMLVNIDATKRSDFADMIK